MKYVVRYATGDLKERLHRWTGTYATEDEARDAIDNAPEDIRPMLCIEERE